MNQEIRVAMERQYLGETEEERRNKFYYIMKAMNECGEIEFLHALSSICIERSHDESLGLDESKKAKWFIISKISSVLKDKLIKQRIN